MRRMGLNYSLPALRGDVSGGVAAAVVVLPLALAYGVASGLGPAAGLYGAIAAGFFAAIFGGTRSLITGPSGAMTVAIAGIVVTLGAEGDPVKVFFIIVLAGAFQVLLGLLRIGRFVVYTPYSVISGFMSGIGIIIILLQLLPIIGQPVMSGRALNSLVAFPGQLGQASWHAAVIGAVALGVCIFWPKSFNRYLPYSIAALLAGTGLGLFWLTGAPVIGEIPTGLPDLWLPRLLGLPAGELLGMLGELLLEAVEPALILALLGAIDSLLTSLAVDAMTRSQHNPNRELMAQGVGNMASGLVGGLASAGNMPGTAINIRTGGRTPVAGALHASLLLALALGLGVYAEDIPHAVLAGILIKTGWDIIDWPFLRRSLHIERAHLLVMGLTLGLTVFLDLTTAVAIGLIAAGMVGAWHLEWLELDRVVSAPLLDRWFLPGHEGNAGSFVSRVGLVAFNGNFSVASANKMVNAVGADIREHEVVILDFSAASYVDVSAAMVIKQMVDVAVEDGTGVIIMGLSGQVARIMTELDALGGIPEEWFVGDLEEAKEVAGRILEG